MRAIAGILLLAVGLVACGSKDSETAGVVIVNARVIDGSGGPSRQVNVRVVGERIDAVGDIEPRAADRVVDASGLVLAPGFIDVHSHHDEGLFDTPDALAAVSQGITTVVVGQDGGHPWRLREFFARLDSSPAAVNVAAFAGHGSIRGEVMGDDYRRPATAEEVAAMAELLRAEMRATIRTPIIVSGHSHNKTTRTPMDQQLGHPQLFRAITSTPLLEVSQQHAADVRNN